MESLWQIFNRCNHPYLSYLCFFIPSCFSLNMTFTFSPFYFSLSLLSLMIKTWMKNLGSSNIYPSVCLSIYLYFLMRYRLAVVETVFFFLSWSVSSHLLYTIFFCTGLVLHWKKSKHLRLQTLIISFPHCSQWQTQLSKRFQHTFKTLSWRHHYSLMEHTSQWATDKRGKYR